MIDTMTPSRLDRYAAAILNRRWLVTVLATLLMLVVTGGARFIGVTNDYRSMFAEDNPQLAAFDALEDTYSASNAALIAVAPQGGSVFAREALGAIEGLTDAAWRAPWSTRVDSLTNYSHSEAIEDDLVVEPLVDDAQSFSDADVAQIEAIALSASDVAGRLVSHDGRVAGLVINFALPENPDAAVVEITDYLDALLDEARTNHPDIAYYLTGDVVMNRAFAEATQDDLETLAPIVFLIIVVTAAVLLRSVLGTLALVVVLMFVINTTMGLAGWTGTVFNPANSSVPIIVMTVAVAHSVHIVTAALAGMSRGLGRNEAIAESLRGNAWPVFLTSATTAIGFLSLNASDSPPFHVLGNLVAFGVLCAFVYSMTLLPALLSILPLRAQAWLRANAPDLATEASGVSIVFARLSQRNIGSMLRGTIIAMALISFILIWVFKSVRLGLVSLVPNFLPAAMAFGLWGYLVGRVGLAGSVVTAMAFGIIVDDTIHFLCRYLEARREGLLAPEAVHAAFRAVGQALWTTTAVLSLGFLVFASSGFELSWALGLLITIMIVFALLADFLLLPPLLMAIDRRK